VLPLKVSGAFHSPLMNAAVPGLRDALAKTPFQNPSCPVIANATAEPVTSPERAVEQLAAQLTAPVRWVESMLRLDALHPGARWIELGPGAVLAGLLKRIVPGAECASLGTAAQVESWMAA